MKYITKFPVTSIFFTFFLSSCAFAYLNSYPKVIISSILLITISILLILRNLQNCEKISARHLLLLSAVAAAGIYSTVAFDFYANSFNTHSGKTDYVKIRIIECEYSLPYTSRYKAVIEESELLPTGTKLLLSTEQNALSDGTTLFGNITYSALSETNTASFDGVRYYLPKKIMITADDISLVQEGEKSVFSIESIFRKINLRLSAMIMGHFSHDVGGIQAAVLLGNKENLPDTVTRDFRRLGISHLLVVSGTHFSVIVAFAERGLRRLRVERKLRACLNIAIIIFFMLITGFTPSVVRAGIMYIIAQFSLIVSKKVNTINSVAFSGALMVLVNPYIAVDCGMQLSFIAAYTCIVFTKYRAYLFRNFKSTLTKRSIGRKTFKFIMNTAETILMTTFVTLATLPLMWLYFGEISLMAIPANIIFIPCVTILMYLTGAYLLLYPLKLFIYPMSLLISAYCGVLENIADFLAKPDFAMISINYPFSIFFLIPISAAILALPFTFKKYFKKILISATALFFSFVFIIAIVNAADFGNVRISYVSDKKNDGLIVKSEGKILICDISDASFGFSYNLTEEMSRMNSCEIEAFLLTHYHNKHIQLLSRLCEREILHSVIMPEPIDEREFSLYNSLCKTAELHGTEVYTIQLGESYIFNDAEIKLLSRKYLSRSTHPITALAIYAHGESAVYASCSFNQSIDEVKNAIENSDFAILGRHSPVYKKTFGLSFDEKPKAIVLSESAYEYMDSPTQKYVNEFGYIRNPEFYRIIIKKIAEEAKK